MNYETKSVSTADKEALAELRITAMKESLENIGRFNPANARNRFLDKFSASDTRKITINNELAGFYVIRECADHIYLDHLYFYPQYQSFGLGGNILTTIINNAKSANLPIRLAALRDSRSNDFYKSHGFKYTHEDEWDIYYEFTHS